MTFEEVNNKLKVWAKDRGIDEYSDKQVMKLTEEVGELTQSILKENTEQEKDSVGDVLVVLSILCHQRGIDIIESFNMAYSVIENRTGKTINGTFVKTTDLEG